MEKMQKAGKSHTLFTASVPMADDLLPPAWDRCLQQASERVGWTVVKGEETPLPPNEGFWINRHHVEMTSTSTCNDAVQELDAWLTRMLAAHPEATEKVVRVSGPRCRNAFTGNNLHLMEAFALVPKRSLLQRAMAILWA